MVVLCLVFRRPHHGTPSAPSCVSHLVPDHPVASHISGLKLPIFFLQERRGGEVLSSNAGLVDVEALVLGLVAVLRVHQGIKIYLLSYYLKIILGLKDAAKSGGKQVQSHMGPWFAFAHYHVLCDINP